MLTASASSLDKAFGAAGDEAAARIPPYLRKCLCGGSYSRCRCDSKQLTRQEVRYICQVLEARKEVRIWVAPLPNRLSARFPPYHWNDRRKVEWTTPVSLWDITMLGNISMAYNSDLLLSNMPHSHDATFYRLLLENIRKSNSPFPKCNSTEYMPKTRERPLVSHA
jgi:hypothetical protein